MPYLCNAWLNILEKVDTNTINSIVDIIYNYHICSSTTYSMTSAVLRTTATVITVIARLSTTYYYYDSSFTFYDSRARFEITSLLLPP